MFFAALGSRLLPIGLIILLSQGLTLLQAPQQAIHGALTQRLGQMVPLQSRRLLHVGYGPGYP